MILNTFTSNVIKLAVNNIPEEENENAELRALIESFNRTLVIPEPEHEPKEADAGEVSDGENVGSCSADLMSLISGVDSLSGDDVVAANAELLALIQSFNRTLVIPEPEHEPEPKEADADAGQVFDETASDGESLGSCNADGEGGGGCSEKENANAKLRALVESFNSTLVIPEPEPKEADADGDADADAGEDSDSTNSDSTESDSDSSAGDSVGSCISGVGDVVAVNADGGGGGGGGGGIDGEVNNLLPILWRDGIEFVQVGVLDWLELNMRDQISMRDVEDEIHLATAGSRDMIGDNYRIRYEHQIRCARGQFLEIPVEASGVVLILSRVILSPPALAAQVLPI